MAVMLPDDDAGIETAAQAIREGKLAAFPTETVYGLGADAFNTQALARVFEVKGRPRFDPLIVHIAEMDAVLRVADLEQLAPEARRIFFLLAERFWPGPLTVILPKRENVPGLATAGLPRAALRFPAHPAAQKLILRSTGAVAAPSANRFGRLSPTTAAHVLEQLGDRIDYIVDGGPALVGVESTVIDLASCNADDPPRILRPGGVPRESIEAVIGPVEDGGSKTVVDSKTALNSNTVDDGRTAAGLIAPDAAPHGATPPDAAPHGATPHGATPPGATLLSPGQMKSHYAPETPLFLHSRAEMISLECGENEGMLFFSGETRALWRRASWRDASWRDASWRDASWHGPALAFTLSEAGDSAEAASRLFSALHELDAAGLSKIHAETAPETGLGRAINDRLRRAAADAARENGN